MENSLSGSLEAFPRPFPPDLERLIFEVTALSRPVWIPTLMLVAWRVKNWVEPLLYRIVFIRPQIRTLGPYGFPPLTTELLLRTIANKGPQFLSNAVQNINFDTFVLEITDLAIILDACTGLRNLVLNIAPGPCLLAIGSLNHLCRLEIVANAILLIEDDVRPVFPCLTHLELMSSVDDETGVSDLELPKTYAALRRLPQLTHLALGMLPTQLVVETIQQVDAQTPLRLESIVFLVERSLANAPFPEDDPRFVCVIYDIAYRLDWLRGADTGDDYWKAADCFIAAKRAGAIDRTQCEVVLSAYDYVPPPES
ncbi:hypothetical protein B0H16DRAFT_786499 [Mycena metata]|uniref:Uncharacterized protein n=1 Tax=Mycena metata TaxID=1033252 RepID=A0AAD7DU20_9AGAR|nr:hypothetical protein B0H16DRAFT_786499 [Mycena metata]